jgi:integrase
MGRNGFGHIYQRGPYWWIKYYDHGAAKYESSKSTEEQAAKDLLKKRLAEVVTGPVTPGRVTIAELLDDCQSFYDSNRKSAETFAKSYINKLKASWKRYRVAQVTTAKLIEYQKRRQSDGVSNATINREMAMLRRAFSLGKAATPAKVAVVPHFPMLPEDNARRGFLEPEQYRALLAALPPEIQPLLVVGYHTGARKAELLTLRWSEVNLAEKTIALYRTKTGAARVLPIYGDMVATLETQRAATPKRCSWVFHRAGAPIKDFRKTWEDACTRAGVTGLLFHDLRRSAVRNMVRAGIPERVVMSISGHKTRAVFDRYNITSMKDLTEAGEKAAAFLDEGNIRPKR